MENYMKLIIKMSLFNNKALNKNQEKAIDYLKEKCRELHETENNIRNSSNLIIAIASILSTGFYQVVAGLSKNPNISKFFLGLYFGICCIIFLISIVKAIQSSSQKSDNKISDFIQNLSDDKEITNDLLIKNLKEECLNIQSRIKKKNNDLAIAFGLLLTFIIFYIICGLPYIF